MDGKFLDMATEGFKYSEVPVYIGSSQLMTIIEPRITVRSHGSRNSRYYMTVSDFFHFFMVVNGMTQSLSEHGSH